MRGAVFHQPGRPLVIEELPEPSIAADEILIEVGRCGICGTDVHMTSGEGPQLPAGAVPGHEYAGTVLEVGERVQRFKPGDLASALSVHGCGKCSACLAGSPPWCTHRSSQRGGLAQLAVAKEHASVRLPSSLTMTDGALVEPFAVSLHGVSSAGLKPGARVLVIGAGAVGLTTAFWARRAGAAKIVMIARTGKSAAVSSAMGADALIRSSDASADAIHDALAGAPDIIFECSGVSGTIQQALNLAPAHGKIVVLGFCGTPDTISPGVGLFKELDLQFAFLYSTRDFEIVADVLDRASTDIAQLVTTTVGLDTAPQALEALRASSHLVKVHVDPAASGGVL